MSVEIILLAMVAIFVGLRLYSVLGQRTGHEQKPITRPIEQPATMKPAKVTVVDARRETGDVQENVTESAVAGVRAITAIDPNFDVDEFLTGARSAYRMILEAYWKGDDETLGHLVGAHVRASFGEAIAARAAEGHVLDNRLVAIEHSIIEEAVLEVRDARLSVRFDADIAAVTRDKDGAVVAGSMSDAVQTHDLWTFARNLKDSDPNWLLVETDESA